jgi:hypothetical protein
VSTEIALLGVDRDRRLARRERRPHTRVDETELGIAVGMAGALARLARGLQRVAEPVQQFARQGVADLMAQAAQAGRQLAQAPGCPKQRRLRVAAAVRLDQGAQVVEQGRILGDQRLAPAAFAAHALRIRRVAVAQFGKSAPDGRARQAGGARHCRDTAAPGGERLGGCKPAPAALVQHRSKGVKALADGRFIDHPNRLVASTPGRNPPSPTNRMSQIHLFTDNALVLLRHKRR